MDSMRAGNSIEDKGAIAISEAMKINTALTKLDLSGDDIWIRKNEKKSIKMNRKLYI